METYHGHYVTLSASYLNTPEELLRVGPGYFIEHILDRLSYFGECYGIEITLGKGLILRFLH